MFSVFVVLTVFSVFVVQTVFSVFVVQTVLTVFVVQTMFVVQTVVSSPVVERPSLTGACRIFELDPCGGYGKVCLVYRTACKGRNTSDNSIYLFILLHLFNDKCITILPVSDG